MSAIPVQRMSPEMAWAHRERLRRTNLIAIRPKRRRLHRVGAKRARLDLFRRPPHVPNDTLTRRRGSSGNGCDHRDFEQFRGESGGRIEGSREHHGQLPKQSRKLFCRIPSEAISAFTSRIAEMCT
jgi:hypothetical protein